MNATKRVRARLAAIVAEGPTDATNAELAERLACSTRMVQDALSELRRQERVAVSWLPPAAHGMPPGRLITWTQTDDEGGAR